MLKRKDTIGRSQEDQQCLESNNDQVTTKRPKLDTSLERDVQMLFNDSSFAENVNDKSLSESTKDEIHKLIEEDDDFLTVSQLNEFVANDSIGHLNESVENSGIDHFQFTQYCNNSQFMNQIEEAISHIQTAHQSQSKKRNSNAPLRHLADENVNRQSIMLNQSLHNIISFTPKYAQEVNENFNFMEKSISLAGCKEEDIVPLSLQVTQSKLNDILNKTLCNPDIIKKVLKHAEDSVNINKDQLDKNASALSDIGFLFQSAFLENVNKTLVEPTQKDNNENPEFHNCGNFFGLPDKVKELIKIYKGINELYDWQIECLKLPAVEKRKNLIYALPTSGGKTLVAEILIFKEILCRKKNAIFILPYVAIVQEKVWAMSPFAVAMEFLVEEYAGGKGMFPPRKRRRKKSVYICTIEKALGLINSLIEDNRTEEIGLVVVDELHLLGEGSRGACLESLLTKIKVANKEIQIVGMSATIGNINEIGQFLNADIYSNNFRPVELLEYVKCEAEIARVNKEPTDAENILVLEKTTNYYKGNRELEKIDPDHLGGLVMDVIPDSSCLIFCKTRQSCENVAKLLCKVLKPQIRNHRQSEKLLLKRALKEESGNLCRVLRQTLDFGIAYHHSGLTMEERRIIEEGFRNGVISVICCTSTLAAGVNLPAKRVIIRNPYIGRTFINLARYKQMIGRAGRAGFGEVGESILICAPNELPRIKEMLLAPMDVALSSLHENSSEGLQNFQLSCLSLGIAKTKQQLQEITNQTLMAVQSERLQVDVRKETRQAIKCLFKSGALITQEMKHQQNERKQISFHLDSSLPSSSTSQFLSPGRKDKLSVQVQSGTVIEVTDLGKASMKAGLDLGHAHILYEDLIKAQKSLVLFTGLHLMYLVTPYTISEQVNPKNALIYNLFTKLDEREMQTARVLGFSDAVARKLLTNQKITEMSELVMKRFYVTLMLYDLWNEMSLYDVSQKYEINRGLIQNLMTSAATFSSNVYYFCCEFSEFWAFSLLLKGMSERLSHCCVKELIPLMKLPAVKQNRAKQLFNAGFKTLQSIARATPEQLMDKIEFMSRKLATQLIAASKLILLEKVENLREEAEEVLDGIKL